MNLEILAAIVVTRVKVRYKVGMSDDEHQETAGCRHRRGYQRKCSVLPE